jgi:hypothetical protein
VRSPKKFHVHLCQKVLFILACFKPRPENPASNEKDALFGLDTQITVLASWYKNLPSAKAQV